MNAPSAYAIKGGYLMATTGQYTIDEFVSAAKEAVQAANGNRQQVVEQLQPLVEKVVWDEGLFDEKYRAEPENGRPRYLYHTEDDGSLMVYVVEFVPGMPTPVHDHLTWGLIGVCGGAQKTARYQRVDDGSKPGHADLKLLSETVLNRGAVYPLLPPNDIHRIETVGDQPSYSLHVLGVDLGRQHRNIFDPATGEVTAIAGQGM
jgi:predicted metal-dependent enzyme (double-stranded beta helix superfamily)